MNTQMHWATDLIGRPYQRGAHGPEAFDCWGLVRHVFDRVHGIAMPAIAVGQLNDASLENVAAIKQAAAVSGWLPSSDTQPAEHDIVLMSSLEGRHVGVIVSVSGSLFLLHCIERVGVCVQSLLDLQRMGFHGFTFWRFQA